MGISDEAFYGVTPGRFTAIRDEWIAVRHEESRNWALLRMDLINFSFNPPKQPVQLDDLLARREPARNVAPSGAHARGRRLNGQARNEIASALRRLFTSREAEAASS